jgi:hypothetical protein
VQKVGHTVLAVLFAAAAALIVWKRSIWRVIGPTGPVFFLLIFIVFSVVFYSFLEWRRKRPDEIAKRVPTPSKELQRKTKQFSDNTRSFGRIIPTTLLCAARLWPAQGIAQLL